MYNAIPDDRFRFDRAVLTVHLPVEPSTVLVKNRQKTISNELSEDRLSLEPSNEPGRESMIGPVLVGAKGSPANKSHIVFIIYHFELSRCHCRLRHAKIIIGSLDSIK